MLIEKNLAQSRQSSNFDFVEVLGLKIKQHWIHYVLFETNIDELKRVLQRPCGENV